MSAPTPRDPAPTVLHEWEKNADGDTDIFAMEADFHNGPRCTRCHASFCHHCHPNCYTEACPAAPDATSAETPMTPADPTPVPRHLSEAERALWENASGPLADVAGFKSSVLRSLLTALSSEREAGERDRQFAPVPDGLQVKTSWALPVGCLYAHPDTLKMPDAQAIVDAFNVAAAAPSTETPHAD